MTCEAEESSLEMAYYLSTAFLGGVLSRCDDRRPPWLKRMRLLGTADLPAELQDHTAAALRVVATKFRQDANQNSAKAWAPSVKGAAALWRTCFAVSVAKIAPWSATPALFMAVTQTLMEGFRAALSKIWLEVQDQFTTKISKYRGLKARPPWSVLEALYQETLVNRAGFGIRQEGVGAMKSAAKASSLQDFAEEALVLQFAIDICEAALDDAQDYLGAWMKRKQKVGGISRKKRGANDAENDAFGNDAWCDDAEHRALCHMATRLLIAADGPCGYMQAATISQHLLLGIFTGLAPLLRDRSQKFLLLVTDSHAQAGKIPPFQVDVPEEAKGSLKFDLVALSYMEVYQEFKILLQATPLVTLNLIRKVQGHWRGYILRVKHLPRLKQFAYYCKICGWPAAPSAEERREKQGQTAPAAARARPQTLEEQIEGAQPSVSKFLGGPDKSRADPTPGASPPPKKKVMQQRKAEVEEAEEERTQEHEAFVQEQLDFDNSIAACGKAVELLTKFYGDGTPKESTRPAWMSLVQSLQKVNGAATAMKKHMPKLETVLQTGQTPGMRGSTMHTNYEVQTGDALSIVEQVKGLQQTFQEDKESSIDQEQELSAAFTNLMAQKTEQLNSLVSQRDTQQAVLTQVSQELEENRNAEATAKATLLDEQAYLSAIQQEERDTVAMFEQRQHDRAEEKTAVNMALRVLSQENPALLQMHHQTVQKRVLKKARAVAQGCPRCHAASMMLRQKASNLHSELLATAAMTTGSGEALVPVVAQLNDLVRRIDEQQKAEEEHKDWCEHELAETAKTKAHHEQLVKELTPEEKTQR